MSALRVPLKLTEAGRVVLDERTARYVARVHRMKAGDRFVAFDPELGLEADAHVVSVGRDVCCDVGPTRAPAASARSGVTLLQCLGKGDKPEQVIRDATALGAERVVLVESSRVVVRVGDRAPSRRQRWHVVSVEAARQCGRGDVPELVGPCPFEEALALVSGANTCRLCLTPEGTTRLASAIRAAGSGAHFVVLIGPEGGLDRGELAQAEAQGFALAALSDGGHVLRTETAAVVALGVIAALTSPDGAPARKQ